MKKVLLYMMILILFSSFAYGINYTEVYKFDEVIGITTYDSVSNYPQSIDTAGFTTTKKDGASAIRINTSGDASSYWEYNYNSSASDFKAYCYWYYKEYVSATGSSNGHIEGLGNGANYIKTYVGRHDNDSIKWWDGSAKDTGKDLANGVWGHFCMNNINYVSNTYDFWFNATLLNKSVSMTTGTTNNNSIKFYPYAFGVGSYSIIDEFYLFPDNLSQADIIYLQSNFYISGGNFTVLAIDDNSFTTIYNFSALINGTTYYSNITTGILKTPFNSSFGYLFNITLSATDYLNKTYLNHNISDNLIGELTHTNQLTITIKEEETNDLITQNVTILFYSNNYQLETSTTTGSFYTSEIPNGNYSVKFTSDNYTTRYYTLNFNNSGYLYMTAYLINSTSSVIFTVKDQTTGKLLPDSAITMYRYINNSWQVVESHYTDITARAEFSYIPNTEYKFFISNPDYISKEFTLDPIRFAEYDVNLVKSTGAYTMPSGVGVDIGYEPRIFYANRDNNFTFLIQSPEGLLQEYGFTVKYPTGSINRTNNNAHGQAWDINFTIGNTNPFDTLNLTYYYSTSQTGIRNHTSNFEIINEEGVGNYTLIRNMDKTYGMGLFERVLVATLIVIFVAGIGGLVAGGVLGGVLGLLIMGYLSYIGFVPIYAIFISMITGFFVLSWRSGT